jgi:hypothetical protein
LLMKKRSVGDRMEKGCVEKVGGWEMLQVNALEQGHGQTVAETKDVRRGRLFRRAAQPYAKCQGAILR